MPACLAAAQAVEHYEISRYGTLITWADELGLTNAAKLLKQTLAEEKKTDETLTDIAKSCREHGSGSGIGGLDVLFGSASDNRSLDIQPSYSRPSTAPGENPWPKKAKKKTKKAKKRRYSKSSGRTVEKEMRRYKKGTAKSGPGGKGGKVKSKKQAIAIGLSKARKKGKKVPKKKSRR